MLVLHLIRMDMASNVSVSHVACTRMRRVQVVGLPGSGKSYGIKLWGKQNTNLSVTYIDIRDYVGKHKERKFKAAIRQTLPPLVAESACGVPIVGSTSILLKPPIQTVYDQLEKREGHCDPEYLSILESITIPAQYIISTAHDLPELLTLLLDKPNAKHS